MSQDALRRHLLQLADALGEAPDRIGLTFARRLLAEAQSIASLHPVEARRFLHATPQRLAVCEGGDWRGVALLFDRGNGPELWRDCGSEMRTMGASLRRAAEAMAAGEAPAEPAAAPAVSWYIPSDDELRILGAMSSLSRRASAATIADAAVVNESRARELLRAMEGHLVCRPRGQRSGWALTDAGREAIAPARKQARR